MAATTTFSSHPNMRSLSTGSSTRCPLPSQESKTELRQETSMRNIRVAAVQFQHVPGDKATNLATIARFTAEAARNQVEILAFSECCISGYWHLRKLSKEAMVELAEPVPEGPS